MRFEFHRFALVGLLAATLSVAALAGQTDSKAKLNPPASPQAKTPQPATHFTQGTITSIEANQMVIARKIRGKAEQVVFVLNAQTQRFGNLLTGTRVSVQYRETEKQKLAAAVRELPAKTSAQPGTTGYRPRSKS
jgi:hypothetical protein